MTRQNVRYKDLTSDYLAQSKANEFDRLERQIKWDQGKDTRRLFLVLGLLFVGLLTLATWPMWWPW